MCNYRCLNALICQLGYFPLRRRTWTENLLVNSLWKFLSYSKNPHLNVTKLTFPITSKLTFQTSLDSTHLTQKYKNLSYVPKLKKNYLWWIGKGSFEDGPIDQMSRVCWVTRVTRRGLWVQRIAGGDFVVMQETCPQLGVLLLLLLLAVMCHCHVLLQHGRAHRALAPRQVPRAVDTPHIAPSAHATDGPAHVCILVRLLVLLVLYLGKNRISCRSPLNMLNFWAGDHKCSKRYV